MPAKIADALPAEDANRTAMRIAARAMLCGERLPSPCDICRWPL